MPLTAVSFDMWNRRLHRACHAALGREGVSFFLNAGTRSIHRWSEPLARFDDGRSSGAVVAMATVPPTKTSGLVRTRNVSKSSVGKANYVDGTVVGATAHSNDNIGAGTGATLPIRAQCGAVSVRLLVFLRCRARVKNGTRKER